MQFTPSFLDEIKARLTVSEVVRRRVKLSKSGREWKGLSPFGQERTPSFFVNDQKQAWFDFSSGQNGNVFDFVMQTEGLSFPEAVERLAAEAGLSLPQVSPESERREAIRASLQEVLELAAKYFEDELQGRGGARARGYLADRGLAPQVQRQFRVGYALNEKFALRDHLAAKGATAETMIEAGLLVHGDDIAVPYDRFRDRVMFPICDRSGRVIAFGGRAIEKDVPAKYLNSPETPLFHKGAVLYNHHNARKAAHETGTVIAVEGYVDVIAMTTAGFPHVVAPLGTALTPDQCELLWRMSEEPLLCFDGDRAGRKAAYRAIDTALPMLAPGKSLKFAFLPEGQDPDDLARTGGPTAIADVLALARPLVEVLWGRETEAVTLDTPEKRAALERRLSDLVRQIADETLRRHYGQDLQARLQALLMPAGRPPGGAVGNGGAGYRAARPGFAGRRTSQRTGQETGRVGYAGTPVTASASLTRSALFSRGQVSTPPREALIVLLAMNHPNLAMRYAEELAALAFSARDIAKLMTALLAHLADPQADLTALRAAIDADGLGPVRLRLEATAAMGSQWCIRPGAAEVDAEKVLQQALALHHRARELHKDLKTAEIALGEASTDENLNRLREIQAELSGIEGREASVEGFGISSGQSGTGL